MGVRKKGRRRIVCDDQEYVWYVALDDDSVYYILNIRSEDKSLILSYPIKTRTSYIISKPFSGSHQKMYDYFGKGFNVDYAGVVEWLETEPQSIERDVLIYQVKRYKSD